MKYFVVLPDGQKFGPADVQTLQQWAIEGRIKPETLLESVDSGERTNAASVAGLTFPTPTGPSQPTVTDDMIKPEQGKTIGTDSPYGGAQMQGSDAASNPYTNPPQPGGGAPYPMSQGTSSGTDDGSKEVMWGWVCAVLGLCCCFLVPIGGIVLGSTAKKKGHPMGQAVIIANAVALVINLTAWILYVAGVFGPNPFLQ